MTSQGDVLKALRDLLRNGAQDTDGNEIQGLKELMDRLKDKRRDKLRQYNMDSVVDDLNDQLEEIVSVERKGINDRLSDAKEKTSSELLKQQQPTEDLYKMLEQKSKAALGKLDQLPESVSGKIQELLDYDFVNPDARNMFQALIESLKSQMAQNMAQDLQAQMGSMSPSDQDKLADMMHALNQMIKDK